MRGRTATNRGGTRLNRSFSSHQPRFPISSRLPVQHCCHNFFTPLTHFPLSNFILKTWLQQLLEDLLLLLSTPLRSSREKRGISTTMASDGRKFSLRPQARPVGDCTLEGGHRVFMSPADMALEGLQQGDLIRIRSESTDLTGVAIVWRATDNIGSGHKSQGNPVIRISEWLRGCYAFELKDKYFVQKWNGNLLHIDSITLTNVTSNDGDKGPKVPVSRESLEFWLRYALGESTPSFPAMLFR